MPGIKGADKVANGIYQTSMRSERRARGDKKLGANMTWLESTTRRSLVGDIIFFLLLFLKPVWGKDCPIVSWGK